MGESAAADSRRSNGQAGRNVRYNATLRPALLLILAIPATLQAQTVSKGTLSSARPARKWTASVSSGLADTFQLTLGGMFGAGPAWQNRVQVNLNNAFRKGDAVSVYGWSTSDTPSHSSDWDAGIWYRAPLWNGRGKTLHGGVSLQKWRFPSVKTGTNDWLAGGNLAFSAKLFGVPFAAMSDSRTLLYSPLPKGTLLHSQSYFQHPIYTSDALQFLLRHGPQHTWSWNFYGTNGNRVVRYQATAVAVWRDTTFEAGYRKQFGMQPGIACNRYWSFQVTQSFH